MYDKALLQEELKKRGNLTLGERMLKVEILLESHLTHHEKLTKFLLYPILAGVGVSVVLSLIILISKSEVINILK